jgi:flavin reductase (DIM6/NTAB) family NADH-FMN oxidoreductase RutF
VAAGAERRARGFASSLEQIARDGVVLAAVISEPGQDLTRPGTRATRTVSGWRIDGRKMFCITGADRFAGLHWEPGRHGAPLLTDALATLECQIVAEYAAGDHWIVVGRVDDLRISPSKDPLVFFAGSFLAVQ